MQSAAPPGARAPGADALVGQNVMTKIAGVKLIKEELVEKGQLSVVQIARVARFGPKIQIQPQPFFLISLLAFLFYVLRLL